MTEKAEETPLETMESLYEEAMSILNDFAGILEVAGVSGEDLARKVFDLLKPILRAIFVVMVFGPELKRRKTS